MVRVQIVSDLHIEYKNDNIPDTDSIIEPNADILILAGDIGSLYKAEQLYGFLENICKKFNVPTADFDIFENIEDAKKFLENVHYPIVIKADNLAAGKGVFISKNISEANTAIDEIFNGKFGEAKEILIEEYISGRELTVSTIKLDKKIHALAVTEIKSKNNFFDYKAKYSKGYAKHILPAKLNKINYAKCLKFATKAHELLGCNSLARTDFIFDTKKNKIFFLETNTQPGLTPISLLPEQANYKGLSFSEIIFILIKNLNF